MYIILYLRALLDIIEGVPNGPLLCDLSCLLHELVVDASLDVGPGAGTAALATIGKRRCVRDLGRLLHWNLI